MGSGLSRRTEKPYVLQLAAASPWLLWDTLVKPRFKNTMSADEDIQLMLAEIERWGSITQFGVRITTITGTADDPHQESGIASKTDGGFDGYNGSWQIGNWGDTLEFTSAD